MPRLPYMNFPFPFYKNYYKPHFYPHNPSKIQREYIQPNTYNFGISSDNIVQNFKEKNCNDFAEKNKSNKYNNDYLFDLFGLKIYNDDILLVSLIYFLYSEGVKDDSLFIVLTLLLLS